MLILKISDKGHYIEIPGMAPFRTPVEANISHVSINLVVSKLQAQGIKKFEIVSDTKGKEKILTQNDFAVEKKPKKSKEVKQNEKYEERINKLETMIAKLVEKQGGNESSNQEQITNKLSSIEKLLMNQSTQKVIHVTEKKESKKPIKRKVKKKEPVVEEMDNVFIPSINTDGMKIKGGESRKTIKQDKRDIDDSADMLSRILQSD